MGRALKNGPGLEPIHELQASNLLHETLRISGPFPIVGLKPPQAWAILQRSGYEPSK